MKKIPKKLFTCVLRLVQPQALKSQTVYQIPQPVTTTDHTPPSATPQPSIPAIIWTYWNQSQPDSFVLECIASWKLHCPDYQVHLVHPENMQQFVDPKFLPANFFALHPTKQSDWLRLYLVAHHGGFWLDASILLTQSLDWMRYRPEGSPGFTGFYLQKYTTQVDFPVIESWAFGAYPQHPFVQRWYQEFHAALIEAGTDDYLKGLEQREDWQAIRQNIQDPKYLLIHITAQKILREQSNPSLVLYKAEDSAYFYHHILRWKWYLLYPQLCLTPAPSLRSPLIKLRGGERRHFSEMQQLHGPACAGSLWHRALHDAKA